LAAVGALALVTAADAYDPALGVPFGAYARRRILGAFADEMRAMDWASRGIRKRIKETVAQRAEAVRLLRDALDRYFAEGGTETTTTTRVSPAARDAYFGRIAEAAGVRIGD
ncbi:unnamed protein product, partial [Penicillium discolor]